MSHLDNPQLHGSSLRSSSDLTSEHGVECVSWSCTYSTTWTLSPITAPIKGQNPDLPKHLTSHTSVLCALSSGSFLPGSLQPKLRSWQRWLNAAFALLHHRDHQNVLNRTLSSASLSIPLLEARDLRVILFASSEPNIDLVHVCRRVVRLRETHLFA